jgi:hypothetical protein
MHVRDPHVRITESSRFYKPYNSLNVVGLYNICKGKGHPITGTEGPRGSRVIAPFIRDLGDRRGGWSVPRRGRFTPGKDPVPIVQEAGWAPGPFWTCAKNLALTGIRSPDRPGCSQSLYRLSYPGPI